MLLLKLQLQRQKLVAQSTKSMELLIFGQETNTDEMISIAELRQNFESLGMANKKANLIARYLIEIPG